MAMTSSSATTSQGFGVPAPNASSKSRTFRNFLAGFASGAVLPQQRRGPYDRPPPPRPRMPFRTNDSEMLSEISEDLTSEPLVSRTLYLCKLPSDCDETRIREAVEVYGDVRKVTHYTAKQIAFVEFWDIRCAEKARNALKLISINGKTIDGQFSHSRNDRIRDGNTGTLYLRPLLGDRAVGDPNTLEHYRSLFGSYGEIKKISSNRKREEEKFIEYFDLRAAAAALEALNGFSFSGVILELQFANHSSKTVNPESRVHDRNFERSDRRRQQQTFSNEPDYNVHSGYGSRHRAHEAVDNGNGVCPSKVGYAPPPGLCLAPPRGVSPPSAQAAPIVDPYAYAPPSRLATQQNPVSAPVMPQPSEHAAPMRPPWSTASNTGSGDTAGTRRQQQGGPPPNSAAPAYRGPAVLQQRNFAMNEWLNE